MAFTTGTGASQDWVLPVELDEGDQIYGGSQMDTLRVDCDTCIARGPTCNDCVVSVLLGMPSSGLDLDHDERAALAALADSGLVPPLRLVPGLTRGQSVPSPLPWQDYA